MHKTIDTIIIEAYLSAYVQEVRLWVLFGHFRGL